MLLHYQPKFEENKNTGCHCTVIGALCDFSCCQASFFLPRQPLLSRYAEKSDVFVEIDTLFPRVQCKYHFNLKRVKHLIAVSISVISIGELSGTMTYFESSSNRTLSRFQQSTLNRPLCRLMCLQKWAQPHKTFQKRQHWKMFAFF